MFMTHGDKEAIMLQNRRGFIKIAVEHGIPVIPMYHFGNSQLLRFVPRCACCMLSPWAISPSL